MTDQELIDRLRAQPTRRVFHVQVRNLDAKDVPEYMRMLRVKFKRR